MAIAAIAQAGAAHQAELAAPQPSRDLVVAYSVGLGLPLGQLEPVIGQAHYSLSLSAQRFLVAFTALRLRVVHVWRPEIYSSDVSRRFLTAADERIVHVAFGDYASLRLLKCAYNIAYVAWEYASISSTTPEGASLWKNQSWVLSLFDEIWVGCLFAKQAFEKQGLTNVHIVPAPVPDYGNEGKPKIEDTIGPLPCAPLLFDFTTSDAHNEDLLAMMTEPFYSYFQHSLARGRPTVYLTIVSPGDQRKNVEASILGFARFAETYSDVLLVVKLTWSSDTPLHQKLWRILRRGLERLIGDCILKSDSVLFVDGFLEEGELMRLIAAADFYLSTSFAEGLNLPVLEAMSRGAVVISPIHTSMVDYLTPENCIPCAFRAVEVDGETVTGYPIGPVTRYEASTEDVFQALVNSTALPTAELQTKRENARLAVSGKYDVTGVASAIRTRFEDIMADRSPTSR